MRGDQPQTVSEYNIMNRVLEKTVFEGEIYDFEILIKKIFESDGPFFAPMVIELGNAAQSYNDLFNQKGFPVGRIIRLTREKASEFISKMSILGLGRYSIEKKNPIFALIKYGLEYRDATSEEVNQDIIKMGEKGLELIDGLNLQGKKTYSLGGYEYSYNGPKRISRLRFDSLIIPQEAPDDINPLLQNLSEFSYKRDRIETQNYQFYYAQNGRIFSKIFARGEEFSPFKLCNVGDLKIFGKKIYYYPKGFSGPRIDVFDYYKFNQEQHTRA